MITAQDAKRSDKQDNEPESNGGEGKPDNRKRAVPYLLTQQVFCILMSLVSTVRIVVNLT